MLVGSNETGKDCLGLGNFVSGEVALICCPQFTHVSLTVVGLHRRRFEINRDSFEWHIAYDNLTARGLSL